MSTYHDFKLAVEARREAIHSTSSNDHDDAGCLIGWSHVTETELGPVVWDHTCQENLYLPSEDEVFDL